MSDDVFLSVPCRKLLTWIGTAAACGVTAAVVGVLRPYELNKPRAAP